MATISPTHQINAEVMGNNWGTGVANNSAKWLHKYLHPRRAFNANPHESQVEWKKGIDRAAAENRYSQNLAKADLTVAATNAENFGANNYAASGTNKAYKFKRKAAALAQALNTVRAEVERMPRGKGANNEARMLAWARGMGRFKGKIHAGT